MSESRELLVETLHGHREDALTCYDHPPTRGNPVWCCPCGAHELTVSWREHMADAILTSPALDVLVAERVAALGFWDRLGVDGAGMPLHLPMGVTAEGQGPTNDSEAHHFACWCGDAKCPLTQALALTERRPT